MAILVLASHAPSLLNFRGPLLRHLVDAGQCVHVGAPDIDSDLWAELERLGVKVYETPLSRHGINIFHDLLYCLALVIIIQQIRPKIILTYTIKPNIWGAFAARLCGVPSVAMVTGLGYAFIGKGGLKQRFSHAAAVALYRLSTACNRLVVFQNSDDREDFIAAGCLTARFKARMVNGSGVDCRHYAPAPLPRDAVFLMIARLLRNKGVREYGEAVVLLKRSHPHARCFLVGHFGDGPDSIAKDDLDRWSAGGLEYLGTMHDVRPALASCSVYVLPSYREGTPRSVLEALATGRPIITSDAPGCRETVVDGLNGFLVPVQDVKSLYLRMAQLADDPALRSRMARASHRIVHGKFEVNAINRRLIGYLGEVLPMFCDESRSGFRLRN